MGKQALHDLLLTWLPRLVPGGRAVLVVGKNLGADSLQRWLEEQGHPTTARWPAPRASACLEVRRATGLTLGRRRRPTGLDGHMTKYVYDFTEGGKDQKDLLGGKGANLCEMTNLGLPVPPGFVISTEACRAYLASGPAAERGLPEGLEEEVDEHLAALEQAMGKRLGDPEDPLLVSVRSGAKFSMPGMMDTVLNVGLNDESVQGLAEQAGDQRFAWDSYRRLLAMFGETVLGVEGGLFAEALDELKVDRGVEQDVDLGPDDLQALVATYQFRHRRAQHRRLPAGPP